MYFLPVFYTVLQLFSLIAIGFYLRRFAGWDYSFFTSLSRFVVRIGLPLYLFVRISGSDPDAILKSPLFLLASVVLAGTGILVSSTIFRFLPLEISEKRTGIALSTFANSAYIPLSIIEIFPVTLPAVSGVFGTSAPALYIGVYLLINASLQWSLGNYLMTGHGKKPRLKDFITPPFIAVVLSILFLVSGANVVVQNKSLPFFHIFSALGKLSNVTLPLILVNLGAMIGNLNIGEGEHSKRIMIASAVSAVRFLFIPAFFYGAYFLVLRHMNLSPGQLWVLFLETHIPPGTNLAAMAQTSSSHEDFTANTFMVTYILYLILFPFFLMFFLNIMGI